MVAPAAPPTRDANSEQMRDLVATSGIPSMKPTKMEDIKPASGSDKMFSKFLRRNTSETNSVQVIETTNRQESMGFGSCGIKAKKGKVKPNVIKQKHEGTKIVNSKLEVEVPLEEPNFSRSELAPAVKFFVGRGVAEEYVPPESFNHNYLTQQYFVRMMNVCHTDLDRLFIFRTQHIFEHNPAEGAPRDVCGEDSVTHGMSISRYFSSLLLKVLSDFTRFSVALLKHDPKKFPNFSPEDVMIKLEDHAKENRRLDEAYSRLVTKFNHCRRAFLKEQCEWKERFLRCDCAAKDWAQDVTYYDDSMWSDEGAIHKMYQEKMEKLEMGFEETKRQQSMRINDLSQENRELKEEIEYLKGRDIKVEETAPVIEAPEMIEMEIQTDEPEKDTLDVEIQTDPMEEKIKHIEKKGSKVIATIENCVNGDRVKRGKGSLNHTLWLMGEDEKASSDDITGRVIGVNKETKELMVHWDTEISKDSSNLKPIQLMDDAGVADCNKKLQQLIPKFPAPAILSGKSLEEALDSIHEQHTLLLDQTGFVKMREKWYYGPKNILYVNKKDEGKLLKRLMSAKIMFDVPRNDLQGELKKGDGMRVPGILPFVWDQPDGGDVDSSIMDNNLAFAFDERVLEPLNSIFSLDATNNDMFYDAEAVPKMVPKNVQTDPMPEPEKKVEVKNDGPSQAEFNEVQNLLKEYRKELESLKKSNAEKDRRIQELEDEVEKLKQDVIDARNSGGASAEELDRLRKENSKLKKKEKKYLDRISELEAEVEQLKLQLDQLQMKLQALRDEFMKRTGCSAADMDNIFTELGLREFTEGGRRRVFDRLYDDAMARLIRLQELTAKIHQKEQEHIALVMASKMHENAKDWFSGLVNHANTICRCGHPVWDAPKGWKGFKKSTAEGDDDDSEEELSEVKEEEPECQNEACKKKHKVPSLIGMLAKWNFGALPLLLTSGIQLTEPFQLHEMAYILKKIHFPCSQEDLKLLFAKEDPGEPLCGQAPAYTLRGLFTRLHRILFGSHKRLEDMDPLGVNDVTASCFTVKPLLNMIDLRLQEDPPQTSRNHTYYMADSYHPVIRYSFGGGFRTLEENLQHPHPQPRARSAPSNKAHRQDAHVRTNFMRYPPPESVHGRKKNKKRSSSPRARSHSPELIHSREDAHVPKIKKSRSPTRPSSPLHEEVSRDQLFAPVQYMHVCNQSPHASPRPRARVLISPRGSEHILGTRSAGASPSGSPRRSLRKFSHSPEPDSRDRHKISVMDLSHGADQAVRYPLRRLKPQSRHPPPPSREISPPISPEQSVYWGADSPGCVPIREQKFRRKEGLGEEERNNRAHAARENELERKRKSSQQRYMNDRTFVNSAEHHKQKLKGVRGFSPSSMQRNRPESAPTIQRMEEGDPTKNQRPTTAKRPESATSPKRSPERNLPVVMTSEPELQPVRSTASIAADLQKEANIRPSSAYARPLSAVNRRPGGQKFESRAASPKPKEVKEAEVVYDYGEEDEKSPPPETRSLLRHGHSSTRPQPFPNNGVLPQGQTMNNLLQTVDRFPIVPSSQQQQQNRNQKQLTPFAAAQEHFDMHPQHQSRPGTAGELRPKAGWVSSDFPNPRPKQKLRGSSYLPPTMKKNKALEGRTEEQGRNPDASSSSNMRHGGASYNSLKNALS